MLLRLRVQGFKNLHDVEIRFGPVTCVAGLNGAGKSNLFDAIRFLHLLARGGIMDAVRELRSAEGRSGDPKALFTQAPGYIAPEIRFEADLLVPATVRDDFGQVTPLSNTALRYEVAFQLDDPSRPTRLVLCHESLNPLSKSKLTGILGFPGGRDLIEKCVQRSGRSTSYVDTIPHETGLPAIVVRQDQRAGRTKRLTNASEARATVVSGLGGSEFPTLLAVKREMESWRLLMLEPTAMRSPSKHHGPSVLTIQGGNLPAVIKRLERGEDNPGRVRATIANTLGALIPEVVGVELLDDPVTETYTVMVRERDGVPIPAQSLSDGTLRFLVLATLSLDPEAVGVICLEEPENGIHPDRIPAIVQLLRDIAVDPECPMDDTNPLRQVIVNTHSPGVVDAMDRRTEVVYFDYAPIRLGDTLFEAVRPCYHKDSWRLRKGEDPVFPDRLFAYLPQGTQREIGKGGRVA